MTSLVRPILSSILCCMIAFGHSPAWLHVATCEDGCGDATVSDVADSNTSIAECSHGCCHHASNTGDWSDAAASELDSADDQSDSPVDPSGHHDPDSCAICQSLASSIGIVAVSETNLAPQYVCEILLIGCDQHPTIAFFSSAAPRGPPAVA